MRVGDLRSYNRGMSDVTTIYLVRHAESLPSEDAPEPEWPLSPLGQVQAKGLVDALLPLGIDVIYSSPYPRARDTLIPFGETRGLPVQIQEDLHERVLSRHSLRDRWTEVMDRYWAENRLLQFLLALEKVRTAAA